MDAIVTAGGKPAPQDSLFSYTQGGYKAMLEMAGKPLIQWVLDALDEASQIDHVVVVGLPLMIDLNCKKLIKVLPGEGNIVDNLIVGGKELLKIGTSHPVALAVSSDLPGITAEMVNWSVQQIMSSLHDFYYFVVERTLMEATFPGSRRTYLRLKDMEVCGGDINGIRLDVMNNPNPVWKKLIESRKNPLQQASILGLDTMLGVMLRMLTLAEAEKQFSQRLHMHGHAIPSAYAEIGMDVDKPFQFEIMRKFLEKRPV